MESMKIRLPEPATFLTGGVDMLTEMWPETRAVASPDDLLKALSGRAITKEIRVLYIVGAHLFQERALLDSLFPNLKNIYLFEPLDTMLQELRNIALADERVKVF